MVKIKYRFIIGFLFYLVSFQHYGQCSSLDAGDDFVVTCDNNMATLTAQLFPGINALTNTYEVTTNTPCPLPPEGSIMPSFITKDDYWSDAIDLPFTFYFFGEAYTQVIIGANGVLSFDMNRPGQTPGGNCAWELNVPLPSTELFRNTIFGAYHDLDISVYNGGTIKYYVSGEYPQRKFVISYENVAQYWCNDLRTTQRIILYESSNVIDVQIDRKDTCLNWNNGNAVIGIQNESGIWLMCPREEIPELGQFLRLNLNFGVLFRIIIRWKWRLKSDGIIIQPVSW